MPLLIQLVNFLIYRLLANSWPTMYVQCTRTYHDS